MGRTVTRRRIPNLWASKAEETRASLRLQQALRSRLTRHVPSERTGTPTAPCLQGKYYGSALVLARTLRKLRRDGGDVERELLKLGSVYVLVGSQYRRILASDAALLAPRGRDTLPHHLRDKNARPYEGSSVELRSAESPEESSQPNSEWRWKSEP